ncbi:MAG: cob(I)yrinic acid a,c-diamide adenosyltransferase [Deltaproteobacteria bacterium]|nr:cob(I)yrinic acid a,c-diamide adenosyltransferase [Deltaproteobacteria bacterium]
MENRRILIFTGNGKGKTTAALGMALRASGHGMRVKIIQFIKNDDATGEVHAIRNMPGIELVQSGRGFIPPPSSPAFAGHREAAEKGLQLAAEAIASGTYDLVVLDELCTAVACRLLDEQQVLETVHRAGRDLCLVMTGRGATAAMMELADTVTEMTSLKHALEKDMPARKGVEF